MSYDRNRRAEIDLAKVRAELANANAEIARLTAELTELRLDPPPMRRGNALPGKLTPTKINSLIKEATQTGKRTQVGDCENLSLQIIPGREKISVTWMFRWGERVTVGTNQHKSRSIGLGQYRNVDIYQAREMAVHYRQLLQKGKDPEIERDNAMCDEQNARDAFKTVNQVIDRYFANKIARLSIGQRRKVDGWFRPVRERIGNMPIQKVTTDIVLKADGCDIERLWFKQHPTGNELLGHLRRMISFAKQRGWFKGENPAVYKDGLEHVLPKPKQVHKVKHHASMPYLDVPNFIPELRAWRYKRTWHLLGLAGRPISAYAVEMLILTGVRTAEVQRARYSEFDFNTMIWTIPGFDEDGTQRTKTGEVHYVPITTGVAAIIEEMKKVRVDPSPNAYVFPSIRAKRRGQPISHIAMGSLSKVMRDHLKLGKKFVNHGFRSTLRTFCSVKKYPERWWDIQVGHVVGDATRQSYPLEQLIEERREMMQAWDDFCNKPPEPKADSTKPPAPKADNIVNLTKRRSA
jgi:integrase